MGIIKRVIYQLEVNKMSSLNIIKTKINQIFYQK